MENQPLKGDLVLNKDGQLTQIGKVMNVAFHHDEGWDYFKNI